MAAFKRKDRPREGYRIWPTIPGFGRVGPWQTGSQSKRTAEAMEAWVVAEAGRRPDAIEGLLRGDFSLRELWVANVRSTPERDHVAELLLRAGDPLLKAAADEYRDLAKDERVKDGLRRLPQLADAVASRAKTKGEIRLSWLLTPANVSALYALAEESQSPAGVRRSIHRAVSELLARHHGKARVQALMLDVEKPVVADERQVRVTPDELRALLAEFWTMEPRFHDFVALAVLCAVDRTPLTRIRPRYFDEAAGTLEVFDSKTGHRHRTIGLSAPAVGILRRVCAGLALDDVPFGWTDGAIRHRWEAGRDRAAAQPGRGTVAGKAPRSANAPAGVITLAQLRFKDLRHLLPTAWSAMGLPRSELQEVMGHAPGSTMTDRYITPVGAREHMDQVASYLGLDRLHLRAEVA